MLGKIYNNKISSILIVIVVLFLIMWLLRYFGMYEGILEGATSTPDTSAVAEPGSKTALPSNIKKYNF